MAKIPVETLTEHCWEKCQGFEVEVYRVYDCADIVFQTCECRNRKVCARGLDAYKEEIKWNNESAEEK